MVRVIYHNLFISIDTNRKRTGVGHGTLVVSTHADGPQDVRLGCAFFPKIIVVSSQTRTLQPRAPMVWNSDEQRVHTKGT